MPEPAKSQHEWALWMSDRSNLWLRSKLVLCWYLAKRALSKHLKLSLTGLLKQRYKWSTTLVQKRANKHELVDRMRLHGIDHQCR